MISSNCAIYDSKKSRFIKDQEASGLLTSLGIRTPFPAGTQCPRDVLKVLTSGMLMMLMI